MFASSEFFVAWRNRMGCETDAAFGRIQHCLAASLPHRGVRGNTSVSDEARWLHALPRLDRRHVGTHRAGGVFVRRTMRRPLLILPRPLPKANMARDDYQSDGLALAALEKDGWSVWLVAKRNATVYGASTPNELLKLVQRQHGQLERTQ
jgi:hypothetical protein